MRNPHENSGCFLALTASNSSTSSVENDSRVNFFVILVVIISIGCMKSNLVSNPLLKFLAY